MKYFIPIVFLLIISFCSFSQDVIYKATGEKYNCKITGEDSTSIYFKMVVKGNVVNTYTDKASVLEIKYGEGQNIYSDSTEYLKHSLTFGFLEGGGSLIGVDLELLITDRLGIQAGVGYVGFGGGMNIHFKPAINSSFISLQYWHQGIADTYTQSMLGPSIVLRAKKLFTVQLGFGFLLESGPAWPRDIEPSPIMLTYAIGLYSPW